MRLDGMNLGGFPNPCPGPAAFCLAYLQVGGICGVQITKVGGTAFQLNIVPVGVLHAGDPIHGLRGNQPILHGEFQPI